MRLKPKKSLPIVLAILILFSILAGCASYPRVDWIISVSGDVSAPFELTYKDLAKMPQTELKDILMQKTTSEDTIDSWSGVSFMEIANKAGASPDFVSILVNADDGYQAILLQSELEDAIIALKKDGEWIAEKDITHGPMRLVCPLTPANKWVYAPIEIIFNNQ